MKQAYYFQHDNNSFTDERVVDLRIKHGIAGYGAYWAILEQLHQNEGKMQLDSKRLAFALQLEEQLVDSVINDFGLFEIDNGFFYSKRMLAHFKKRKKISEKRAEAGRKGGKASSKQANAKQKLANAKQKLANAKQIQAKERKGKERKEKEIKENNNITEIQKKYKTIEDIKEDDIESLAQEFDVPVSFIYSKVDDLKSYCEYQGKKYKNYKMALRSFVKRDALKIRKEESEKSQLFVARI
jgi:hypothetical protein